MILSGTALALVLLAGPAAAPPPALYSGRPLFAWMDDLSSRDVLVLEEAVMALGEAGVIARPALPHVRRLLNHPNRLLRTQAALAHCRITGDGGPAILVLCDGLRHSGPAVRREAVRALARLGPAAAPAAPLLIETLDSPERADRALASDVLVELGRDAVPPLLDALAGRHRRAAAELLGQHFSDRVRPDDASALRPALRDADVRVRIEAARLLFGLDAHDADVLAGLTLAVRSDDDPLRTSVLESVRRADGRPKRLLPVLLPALETGGVAARARAAGIVFDIEGRPARVLPVYEAALDSGDIDAVAVALSGIGDVGPAAIDLLPRLLRRLDTYRPAERLELERALMRIGPAAAPELVLYLENLTSESRQEVIDVVASALGELGEAGALAVAPLLGSADEALPFRVLAVVRELGPAAAPLVPFLRPMLTPRSRFRLSALLALETVGSAAGPLRETLVDLTANPDPGVRAQALRVLGNLRLAPRQARSLADRVKKDEPAVRAAALGLLARAAPDDPATVALLVEQLGEKETLQQALTAVADLGPRAARARPALEGMLNDPESIARRAARAIGHLGAAGRPAVPALLRLLTRPGLSAPDAVLSALQRLDPPADDALVAGLTAVVRDRTSGGSVTALALLLGRWKGASGLALEVIRDARRPLQQRQQAAYQLARSDPVQARAALADLRAVRRVEPGNLRSTVAILHVDPRDPEARAEVAAALRSRKAPRRNEAASLLAHTGPAGKPFLPALRALLRNEEPAVQVEAAVAVWRLSGESKEAFPVVEAILKRPRNGALRTTLADHLAKMGTAARPALPALRALENDPDQETRTAARQAVQRIARP